MPYSLLTRKHYTPFPVITIVRACAILKVERGRGFYYAQPDRSLVPRLFPGEGKEPGTHCMRMRVIKI